MIMRQVNFIIAENPTSRLLTHLEVIKHTIKIGEKYYIQNYMIGCW